MLRRIIRNCIATLPKNSAQCSKYKNHNIQARHLLTERSGQCDVNLVDVREALQRIVATPKQWRKGEADTMLGQVSSQQELPVRRMLDSYSEACIPLGSQPQFREKYINFYNTVRFGRLMEDLDTMSVLISYTHHLGRNPEKKCPYTIVTALVDSIHLNTEAIQPDSDILIRGHVTWVGNTSIEVTMSVEQVTFGEWVKLMDAKFVTVARLPASKGKAYICPLEVVTEEEQQLLQEGEASNRQRQADCQESLLRSPPNEQERQIVHELFLKTLDEKAATFKHPIKPHGSKWMETAMLKNVHLCFPQERNLYNKIFGGFLMRQSFELAWANACMHCQARPIAVAVDDIMFKKPVEIGSLLFLSSQVVYTEEEFMQVKVHAEVVDPKTCIHETTNIFHYTFKVKDGQVPEVIPKSYSEYMMYIDGKRHFIASGEKQS